jgi:hypothetical protein
VAAYERNIMTANSNCRGRATAAALLLAAGAIGVGAFGPVAPANAAGTWVALAWSSDNAALGWANNEASEQSAINDATAMCQRNGGGRCVVPVYGENDCAAIAYYPWPKDPPNSAPMLAETGLQGTIGAAEYQATHQDSGFQLLVSRCSTGTAGVPAVQGGSGPAGGPPVYTGAPKKHLQ